jgi:hypothetical protein
MQSRQQGRGGGGLTGHGLQEDGTGEREEGVISIPLLPQMALPRFCASCPPLSCARSSSVLAPARPRRKIKLIGGRSLDFAILSAPRELGDVQFQPVPDFRLRALFGRTEVDRVQPQAEAADEMP